jgi:hypothetical protein
MVGLLTKQHRMDDMTVSTFERKLQYTEQKVHQRPYPQLKAAEGLIVKIETIDAPWAEYTTFAMEDAIGGDFELAEDNTTNLSMVESVMEERSQRIYQFRKGYRFSEKEVIRSVHQGMPIEAKKIAAVRKAYMQTLNKLILTGNTQTKQPGFINHPAWLRIAAPYKLDATSSASQQLATLNAGPNEVIRATQAIFQPDTLLLPKTQYDFLLSQANFFSTGVEQTVLRYFLANNPSIRNIDWLWELAGAGPGGEDLAIFYSRDPDNQCARITSPMRYRELIRRPFEVIRPCAFDWNGIIAYNALSVCVMVGV